MAIKAHSIDSQRGQAAVEMALLLPVLLLIFLAILEVGRVMDAWVVATNAAREGARYAAYGESPGMVRSKVNDYLVKGLGGRSDVALPTAGEITVSGALGVPGDPVRVVVPVKVRIYTPMAQDLGMADGIAVQGTATMRLQ